jgi:hypothetical protein
MTEPTPPSATPPERPIRLGPQAAPAASQAATPQPAKVEPAKAEPAKPGPAKPEPGKPAAPPPAGPPPAARPTHSPRSALAVFTALGFLLVAAALLFLWQRQQAIVLPDSVDPARVQAMEAQLRTLQQRLSVLEARPAAAPAAAPAPGPAVDLRPLEGRIAALEQRPVPTPSADPTPALTGRLDALEQRVTQQAAQASQINARAARLGRLQAAATALEAGQPLGDIPDAPAALSRFALPAPPTQAGLRLSFADAAQAALQASLPASDGLSAGQRIWRRVASLVTVREGGKVILGPPAAKTLADARERLDAGDLAGAVAALDALDPPAAAAMAAWRAQAQSLLDARAALASALAGQARL